LQRQNALWTALKQNKQGQQGANGCKTITPIKIDICSQKSAFIISYRLPVGKSLSFHVLTIFFFDYMLALILEQISWEEGAASKCLVDSVETE
jgi:hypothetical protein